jgi:hypothetical protein
MIRILSGAWIIPNNHTYLSANMYLYTTSMGAGFPYRTGSFYLVCSGNAWWPGTVTNTTQNGACCWNWLAYPSTPWAGASTMPAGQTVKTLFSGCSVEDYDIFSCSQGDFFNLSGSTNAFTAFPIPARYFDYWWGGGVNNGVILRYSGSLSRSGTVGDFNNLTSYELGLTIGNTTFASSENATVAQRPKIEIYYAQSSPLVTRQNLSPIYFAYRGGR